MVSFTFFSTASTIKPIKAYGWIFLLTHRYSTSFLTKGNYISWTCLVRFYFSPQIINIMLHMKCVAHNSSIISIMIWRRFLSVKSHFVNSTVNLLLALVQATKLSWLTHTFAMTILRISFEMLEIDVKFQVFWDIRACPLVYICTFFSASCRRHPQSSPRKLNNKFLTIDTNSIPQYKKLPSTPLRSIQPRTKDAVCFSLMLFP